MFTTPLRLPTRLRARRWRQALQASAPQLEVRVIVAYESRLNRAALLVIVPCVRGELWLALPEDEPTPALAAEVIEAFALRGTAPNTLTSPTTAVMGVQPPVRRTWGWYSARMADEVGVSVYEALDGGEVHVTLTSETDGRPNTHWPDLEPCGEVGRYLRRRRGLGPYKRRRLP